MTIKSFIVILATVSGLIVSSFTAIMTFVIIGEPICSSKLIKITLTVLSVLPVIILLSFFSGTYLSRKFKFIEGRLEKIKEQDFTQNNTNNLISEVHEINEDMNFLSNQLNSLINDLRQKNHNLSNLLISMAHDIKTPITIINGYIEEIEDGLIKEKDMPSALVHMKKEIHFLDELTIDMLEFISSMEHHKTKEKICLYYLIENEIFPILDNKANVKLINDVDKDFLIVFNKIDLKKILLNIIINGIKHTKEGYLKISEIDSEIYFENNGDKINKEYKEKIFEPFFTVSKSKNRKITGFGLGLSIVKNLSTNNGYDTILESSNQDKTIFKLSKTD